MKIVFEELLDYALNKAIPKEWRDFYLNGPEQVDYSYVSQFMTPDQFLFFIRKTHLYESDKYWHPNNVEEMKATKQDGGWLVYKAYRNKKQVKLYSLLPESFNRSELENIAIANGISLDNTGYVRNSKLFTQTGEWPHNITYHLSPFKPITLPPPMHREIKIFFMAYYGLFKDNGRVTHDNLFKRYVDYTGNKRNLDTYDIVSLFKRYLRSKDLYFRHEGENLYFYNPDRIKTPPQVTR